MHRMSCRDVTTSVHNTQGTAWRGAPQPVSPKRVYDKNVWAQLNKQMHICISLQLQSLIFHHS